MALPRFYRAVLRTLAGRLAAWSARLERAAGEEVPVTPGGPPRHWADRVRPVAPHLLLPGRGVVASVPPVAGSLDGEPQWAAVPSIVKAAPAIDSQPRSRQPIDEVDRPLAEALQPQALDRAIDWPAMPMPGAASPDVPQGPGEATRQAAPEPSFPGMARPAQDVAAPIWTGNPPAARGRPEPIPEQPAYRRPLEQVVHSEPAPRSPAPVRFSPPASPETRAREPLTGPALLVEQPSPPVPAWASGAASASNNAPVTGTPPVSRQPAPRSGDDRFDPPPPKRSGVPEWQARAPARPTAQQPAADLTRSSGVAPIDYPAAVSRDLWASLPPEEPPGESWDEDDDRLRRLVAEQEGTAWSE